MLPKKFLNESANNCVLLQSIVHLRAEQFFHKHLGKAAWVSKGLFLFNPLSIKRLRKVVFIPVRLIKKAHEENWLRSLAYFVRMKSLYRNNTHYGKSLRGLAKKLNCTPPCLSHHLKQLKHHGLVVEHAGNLTFLGYNRLQAIEGGKSIGVPVDHANQLDLVRAQLIRFNLSAQKYNIKRSEIQNCQGLVPFTFKETAYSCYAGLSAPGFGKVLGLSPSQGSAIRTKLIALQTFKARRRYSELVIASGGSCPDGAPSGGVLRTAFRTARIQGFLPAYAFLKGGSVLVERRMELNYCGGRS